jgi:uncharacterized membrane protein (DUF485 family)
MKDIHISAKRQKTELYWLLGCFCLAFLLNFTAIITYKTSWTELYSQIFWMLLITFGLYFAILLIRIIYDLIMRRGKR